MPSSRPSIWGPDGIQTYVSRLDASEIYQLLQRNLTMSPADAPQQPPGPTHDLFPEAPILYQQGCLTPSNRDPRQFIPIDNPDIHALFNVKNWDRTGLGDEIVEQAVRGMRPAFALATKFLMCEELRPWWYRMFGEPIQDTASGRCIFPPLEPDFEIKKMKADFEARLDDLAQKITFNFFPIGEHTARAFYNPYDALELLDKDRWGEEADSHINDYKPIIGFPMLYLYHLLATDGAKQDLRFQLLVAQILMHEIAHAMHMLLHGNAHEPYHSVTDHMPEMGYAWQEYVLGCEVCPIPFRTSIIGPLCSISFVQMHQFPSIWLPLHMEQVEKWFLRKSWESYDRSEMQLPTIEKMPKDYKGIFAVKRFVCQWNSFVRVLYVNRKPCLDHKVVIGIPNTPEPRNGTKCDCKVVLGTKDCHYDPAHGVPEWRSIGEWFVRVWKSDTQRARRHGFPDDCIRSGRSKTYIRQCYDGAGESSVGL